MPSTIEERLDRFIKRYTELMGHGPKRLFLTPAECHELETKAPLTETEAAVKNALGMDHVSLRYKGIPIYVAKGA